MIIPILPFRFIPQLTLLNFKWTFASVLRNTIQSATLVELKIDKGFVMKFLSLLLGIVLLSGCATGTPREQTEMADMTPSTTYVDSDQVSNPGVETASKMISPMVR